ncbi:MAG: NAD-dependent succinate-semialdehyde dehydrogenase [Bacilli bacterium]
MQNLLARVDESQYIDGQWQKPAEGAAISVVNPATGAALSEIGFGSAQDAQAAMDAAARAFPSWSRRPARERAALLAQTAALIRERAASIGRILALESGKRMAEAEGEVRFAAEYFQWFAEEIRRPHGELVPGEAPGRHHMVSRQAAGVAVCLTPWNFPVSIQARKLAPALAAGCTVVARPSQRAPLSVIELVRCLVDAGFPAGVVNLVIGPARTTTGVMMNHRALRVVSFTGSTEVGQELVQLSAKQLPKMALELGGNAPFIVFSDADVEQAVEGALIAKFRNNGQSCIAGNRFYVQEGVYDEFLSRLAKRVEEMRVGDPTTGESVDLGPVISRENRERLDSLTQTALRAGASSIARSAGVPGEGFFVPPQFLENVSEAAELSSGEVFGPIAPVHRFTDEEEVIARANDSDMGLAGYVYTSDVGRSVRVTSALECGIIGLNHALPSVTFAPMGGFKKSGLGREGGRAGLEEFLEIKYVSLQV